MPGQKKKLKGWTQYMMHDGKMDSLVMVEVLPKVVGKE